MNKAKYAVSKLYFNASVKGRVTAIAELGRLLSIGESWQSRNYHWGFTDIEHLPIEDFEFRTGYLVKFRPKGEQEVVNLTQKTIEQIETLYTVKAKSRFFAYVGDSGEGLIIHQRVGNDISSSGFVRVFPLLVRNTRKDLFVDIDVEPFKRELDILETVPKFDHIEKIQVSLIPPNPHPDEIWKSHSDYINQIRARKITEIVLASDEGLKIERDGVLWNKLVMVIAGYGESIVHGILDNEPVVIRSEALQEIIEVFQDDNQPNEIAQEFIGRFRRLLKINEQDDN